MTAFLGLNNELSVVPRAQAARTAAFLLLCLGQAPTSFAGRDARLCDRLLSWARIIRLDPSFRASTWKETNWNRVSRAELQEALRSRWRWNAELTFRYVDYVWDVLISDMAIESYSPYRANKAQRKLWNERILTVVWESLNRVKRVNEALCDRQKKELLRKLARLETFVYKPEEPLGPKPLTMSDDSKCRFARWQDYYRECREMHLSLGLLPFEKLRRALSRPARSRDARF